MQFLEILLENSQGLVALAALTLSLITLRIQRKHNRLSVTPNLQLSRNMFEGAIYQWLLTNNGVGPAVIFKFEVFFDSAVSESPDVEAFEKGLRSIKLHEPKKWHVFEKGDFIKDGSEVILIEYPMAHAGHIRNETQKIGFRIVYADIYGKKKTLLYNEPKK